MRRPRWGWCVVISGLAVACGPSGDPSDGGVDAGTDTVPDVDPDSPPDAFVDVADDGTEIDAPADQIGDTPTDQPTEDVDVDAPDAPDTNPDATEDGPGPDAPYPPVCGDGYRDPVAEECDDGLGTLLEPRACTDGCVVVDRIVGDDPSVQERWLASARAVASGSTGHAVAVVEQLEHPDDLDPRVSVILFDTAGRRLGVSHVEGVDFDVAPALAPLPDGSFALFVSEMGTDGEGLGLALYQVPAAGGTPTFVSVVNQSTAYGQHGPAAAWTGAELTVAWLDDSPSFDPQGSGRRVCTRAFDETLSDLGDEACFDETDGFPSNLSVASSAVAWREMMGTTDRIVVEAEGWRWESEELAATSAFEPPAIGWLPGDVLLVIATEGDGIQRRTVLDAGTQLVGFDLLAEPRYEPSVAVTDDGAYLAWSESGDTWVQKILWTGTELDTTTHAAIALPRESAHESGEQHLPALVAGADSVLVASWNDLTSDNFPNQSPHGDVVLELIPTPIVRAAN